MEGLIFASQGSRSVLRFLSRPHPASGTSVNDPQACGPNLPKPSLFLKQVKPDIYFKLIPFEMLYFENNKTFKHFLKISHFSLAIPKTSLGKFLSFKKICIENLVCAGTELEPGESRWTRRLQEDRH